MKLFSKVLKKFKNANFILAYILYLIHKRKNKVSNQSTNDKSLVLKVTNPQVFNRYFYCFVKFFHMAGYSIYLPDFNYTFFKKQIYNRRHEDGDYFRLIFTENLITYSPKSVQSPTLEINDSNLSNDYFSAFYGKGQEKDNPFYLPMPLHPNFYHLNIWNESLTEIKSRKNSIIMAGNNNPKIYNGIDKTPFKVENRVRITTHLKEKNISTEPESYEELLDFIKSDKDNSCIIVDTQKTHINMLDLRNIIHNFNFYLALPGVTMPFCHNIVEAMSVGTIPILHEEYGNLLRPKLRHMENAIFYDNIDDIEDKIKLAYSMSETEITRIQKNVALHYNTYFTPEVVIREITSGKYDNYYLQSGHRSVNILKTQFGMPLS